MFRTHGRAIVDYSTRLIYRPFVSDMKVRLSGRCLHACNSVAQGKWDVLETTVMPRSLGVLNHKQI